MTPIKQTDSDLPDNLPLLTQVADADVPDDLPTLAEVIAEEQVETTTALQSPRRSAHPRIMRTERRRNAPRAFTHKLSFGFEQLQCQSIEQAVNELNAELPELLCDALKTHPGL